MASETRNTFFPKESAPTMYGNADLGKLLKMLSKQKQQKLQLPLKTLEHLKRPVPLPPGPESINFGIGGFPVFDNSSRGDNALSSTIAELEEAQLKVLELQAKMEILLSMKDSRQRAFSIEPKMLKISQETFRLYRLTTVRLFDQIKKKINSTS